MLSTGLQAVNHQEPMYKPAPKPRRTTAVYKLFEFEGTIYSKYSLFLDYRLFPLLIVYRTAWPIRTAAFLAPHTEAKNVMFLVAVGRRAKRK